MRRAAPDALALLGPLLAATAAAAGSPAPEGAPAIQPPFVAPIPWILPEGAVEAWTDLGVEREAPLPFGAAAPGGARATRATLLLNVAGGLGGRVQGAAQLGVQALRDGADGEGPAASDLRLRVGCALGRGGSGRRALTASLLVKAPTAPDRDGLGTDEADLGLVVGGGLRGPRGGAFGSAGVELLGNPLGNGSQDDVALYGAGAWVRAGAACDVTAEVEGRAASRFGNSSSTLRVGLRAAAPEARRPRASVHGSVARGLDDGAPRWSLSVGAAILLP